MLHQMDSAELSEWMAFSAIEPLGAARADFHAGTIAVACSTPWLKEGAKPLAVTDFIPAWGEEEEQEQGPEAMLAAALSWTLRLGGEVK